MLSKSINFGLLGLLAVLSLSNSAIAQQHQHSPSTPTGETKNIPEQMGDQRFITMMIHHDQKTLKMLDLATQKAKNTQIRTLATQIKTDQTKEIEQLQTLYKRLYATEAPTNAMNCMGGMEGMGMGGMGRGQEMGGMMKPEDLANSPNFDQEFVRWMIHHQRMSVNMASKAAENAKLPQIRTLAQGIIKTQTAQIEKWQQLQ